MQTWEKYTALANRYLRVQTLINDIPPVDVEDIRQNIVLHILTYQQSMAALSKQQLTDFIDRAVEQSTKSWKRYRTRYLPMEDELMPTVNEIRQGELNENGFATLKLDVAAILEKLTTRQRVICQCLMNDNQPRQIQKMTRCSLSTLTLELDQIRHRFRRFESC